MTSRQLLGHEDATAGLRLGQAKLIGALLLACALAGGAAVLVGRGDLGDARLRPALISLRGYRLAASLMAGSSLAVAGVLVQGLFRNPLASPSVLGATAGANFGAQMASVLYGLALSPPVSASKTAGDFGKEARFGGIWPVVPEMLVPLGSFAGAMLTLFILLGFLRLHGDLLTLILTGFILSSLFLSLGGFVISLAQESWELGRALVSFSLGSVRGTGPKQILFVAPLLVAALLASWTWSSSLDLMLTGEEEAQAMGADVASIRWWIAVWTSVLVACAVSLSGTLAFVGLIVPHALRPFAGVTHRRLIPAAALGGGAFVALCDALARAVPARGEVPLGVVTGLMGAPLFLLLVLRTRRTAGWH